MNAAKNDRQYTKTHEWVSNDGEIWTLGISDHAQELLGDIVFVELPNVGDKASAGDEICVVESVKTASSVYAPTALTVVAVNNALNDTPELINTDCYNSGWLLKFSATKIDGLMDAADYQALDRD